MAAEKEVKTTGLLGWIDARFPATQLWEDHLSKRSEEHTSELQSH